MIYWLTDKEGSRASLGEKGHLLMRAKQAGMPVPDGFVVAAAALKQLYDPRLLKRLLVLPPDKSCEHKLINGLLYGLEQSLKQEPPSRLADELKSAFDRLCRARADKRDRCLLAVRLSTEADPLSRPVNQRTVLPVSSFSDLFKAITTLLKHSVDRTVVEQKISQGELRADDLAPALLVQLFELAEAAGVASSIDPVRHDPETVVVEAIRGLGGPLVAGELTPDRFKLAKGSLQVIDTAIARQNWQLTVVDGKLTHETIDPVAAFEPKVSQDDLLVIGRMAKQVEEILKTPAEIEWVKGDQAHFLVDVRAIGHSARATLTPKMSAYEKRLFAPGGLGRVSVRGIAASSGTAWGPVKIIHRPSQVSEVAEGDIVVTELTSPVYLPAFRKAAAVVTDTGGVNSHAAVAARELGIPCVVATGRATNALEEGQMVTVDGSQGFVYAGQVPAEHIRTIHAKPRWLHWYSDHLQPITATKIYVNLSDPMLSQAAAQLPVDGVGLLRSEFIVASLGKHPTSLLAAGKHDEVTRGLADKLTTVLAAFAPRPVLYRLSDLKTSEYRNLRDGDQFEPTEENPMLGFRGARRLLASPGWLQVELQAVKLCREQFGHRNLWLMVPFVRTLEEMKAMRQEIEHVGLYQSADFKLWMMVEVPSNVILIRDFVRSGIDGISIGTNDLTALILGVDRDAGRLTSLYPPTNEAVMSSLTHVVAAAKQYGITSSICGSAASTYPEVVETLIRAGITSVSVSPDAAIQTRRLVASVERQIVLERAMFS